MASSRNTPVKWLEVFGVDLLMSYDTVVAAAYKGECIRLHNRWGPTTGRHMRETGVSHWPEAESQEDFDAKVRQMLYQAVVDDIMHGGDK